MPHMVAQEHMGYVNALTYGTARNSATLAAALSAIGSTPSTLVLTLTGDGVWTLTSNVTIPANVILRIPAGVTVNRATGVTLTLNGTVFSDYANWETGPGTTVRGILNHVDISSIKTAHMHAIGLTGLAQPPIQAEHPTLQTSVNIYTDIGGGYPAIDINRSASDDTANWRITNNDVSNSLYFARPSAAQPRMVLGPNGLWLGSGQTYTTPSELLRLALDSAAKPGTNTWTVASDARLKTVLGDYIDGLAFLETLPTPQRYTYNGAGGMPLDSKEYVTFIAQDLQPVAPDWVGSYQDKLQPSDPDPTDILTINTHNLVYVLLNAVKELAARVQALETPLATRETPAAEDETPHASRTARRRPS